MSKERLWCVKMTESLMSRIPRLPFDWSYDYGVALKGVESVYRVTGEDRYFAYIKENIDQFIGPEGTIYPYRRDEYNLDNINNGKILLVLYRETGDRRYVKAIHHLRQQMLHHPRTREGGFWHKHIYPHQMWLDGIYMASPFLAEFAAEIGEDDLFEDVVHQVLLMHKKACDKETGLLYHGYDESRGMKWADERTGCSSLFWGRAIGWYVSAIVDILDHLPMAHPRRNTVIEVLSETLDALAKVQDASGMWYQILDQRDREGNYPETSATSMFAYAMLKALRNGYVKEHLRKIADKAMATMVEHFVSKDQDGLLTLKNVCKVSGLGNNPYRDGSFEYYINEPVVDNDLKGLGAFIQAATEWECGEA